MKGFMLIDESTIRDLLHAVVHNVATEAALHEDLMQEALIHLWQEELQRPGQTQSWYIQSCRFHLLNHLSQGRSIDSVKHRHARCPIQNQFDVHDSSNNNLGCDESPFTSACVRDILRQLSQRIKPVEGAILGFLADGFGAQEIAQKLRISHQAVSKHRQRIAILANQLGISLTQLP